jgi:ABC-type sugar transport system permease subunit
MRKSWFPALLTLGVIAFLFAPLVVLIVNSFNASRFGGEWDGFTWGWYEKLWAADEVWESLAITLKIAVSASLASMLLGTLAAYALHRFRSGLQSAHSMLITLPLVMPDILMGMSLLALFVLTGIETGLLTIWIAHVTFCLSFVTMVVLGRLQDFDFTLIDAARDPAAAARCARGWTAGFHALDRRLRHHLLRLRSRHHHAAAPSRQHDAHQPQPAGHQRAQHTAHRQHLPAGRPQFPAATPAQERKRGAVKPATVGDFRLGKLSP